jgi:hypothetical protein
MTRAFSNRRILAAAGLIAAALLVMGAAWSFAGRGASGGFPPIHDVTTSITHPPRFVKLAVSPGADGPVPDRGRADMAGLPDDLKWRMWHVEAYGRLHAIALPLSERAAFDRATALVASRGWQVALADPKGHIEASAPTGLFSSPDAVAIDIHKSTASDAMVVDMRSVSPGPGGDGGRNAARIRAFLADMKTTAA